MLFFLTAMFLNKQNNVLPMTREPVVAGQFYEGSFEKLEQQIKDCFHHKMGPGALPVRKRSGFVKAVIVPHAGYVFSGPCAAWSYKEIAESEPADLYVLIGPNHFGAGSSVSIDDWKTPFGIIKTDKEFVRELSLSSELPIEDSFHEHEHSVEVQLPFLQFVNKEYLKDMRIACITLSGDRDIESIKDGLKQAVENHGKRITFVISSDFTHYGPDYGYIPFTLDVERKLKELDEGAIKRILEKDAASFLSYVQKNRCTVCGYIPIYLLLRILKDEKGRLLMYYKSADITGDYTNSVSYASIIFK